MNFKKTILFAFSLAFTFITIGRPISTSNEIGKVGKNIISLVKRTIDVTNETDVEDPNYILENAIDEYQSQFSDYINITGLNVSDKEAILLPNFDATYLAPDYTDVMLNYQTSLENSLSIEEMTKYEELRKQDFNFDRYVSLNSIKYRNLQPTLKYSHNIRPIEPINPVTPLHPIINTGGIATRSAAVATATIVLILSDAGLGQTAISAFTACISTMTTGLSTSWIPFVGWALAVALVVGALIALTVIIVQNWSIIRDTISQIKAWFLEQFASFASLITTFFDDAIAKGNESTISSTRTIGNTIFTFTEIRTDDVTSTVAFVQQCRRNKDVLLMQYIKTESFQIALGAPVTSEFCIANKTHLDGCSSYTWYQNDARNLILKAGTGYTSAKPELHLYNENEEDNNSPRFAFKHFHNYTSAGIRDNSIPTKRSHSFFGLLYYTPNNDGEGVVHPNSPQN